jgi:hypothetical protein
VFSAHIRRTIERSRSHAASHLTNDLTELIGIGMLTLNSKLTNLVSDKLLSRLNEVWSFFLTGIVPYLEGTFLPLSTDPMLRQISSSRKSGSDYDRIDVRRLAFIAFRDHIILPLYPRLLALLETGSSGHASGHAHAKRLQMFSLLASVHSADESQKAVEVLLERSRTGGSQNASKHEMQPPKHHLEVDSDDESQANFRSHSNSLSSNPVRVP